MMPSSYEYYPEIIIDVSDDSTDNSDDEDYTIERSKKPAKGKRSGYKYTENAVNDSKKVKKRSVGGRNDMEYRPLSVMMETHTPSESSCTFSRLFEIVIMSKHAKLSSCIQRIYLTLSSPDQYEVIADVLSFICECAGFKHSSITSSSISEIDKAKKQSKVTFDDFDWFHLHRCYNDLPTSISSADVSKPLHIEDFNELSKVIYPGISNILGDKRCVSAKFYSFCTERVQRISDALVVSDGWGIGIGNKNNGFLRFKEFFRNLILDASPLYFSGLVLLLQWIFSLGLCGYRSIRLLTAIACDEIVASLLIKLETLRKDEGVFKKQLEVEVNLDKITHERMRSTGPKGAKNKSKLGKFSLSSSTIELWRRLKLTNITYSVIRKFLMIIFNVNYISKLSDILVDIRIITSFSLLNCALLNMDFYATVHYAQLAVKLLPLTDEVTQLILLRFLAVSDVEIDQTLLNTLTDIYQTVDDKVVSEVIELLFVRDASKSNTILKHPKNEKVMLEIVKNLSFRSSEYLSLLFAHLYLPSITIKSCGIPDVLSFQGIKPRIKNFLSIHEQSKCNLNLLNKGADKDNEKKRHSIKINSADESLGNTEKADTPHPLDSCAFLEILRKVDDIFLADELDSFIYNFTNGVWNHVSIFSDVSGMITLLCKGSDVLLDDHALNEDSQSVLIRFALASFEVMIRNKSRYEEELRAVVEVIMSSSSALLKTYTANTSNLALIIQFIELTSIIIKRLNIKEYSALTDTISDTLPVLVRANNTHCAIPLIRSLANLYNTSTKKTIVTLYKDILDKVANTNVEGGENFDNVSHCVDPIIYLTPAERNFERSAMDDTISEGITEMRGDTNFFEDIEESETSKVRSHGVRSFSREGEAECQHSIPSAVFDVSLASGYAKLLISLIHYFPLDLDLSATLDILDCLSFVPLILKSALQYILYESMVYKCIKNKGVFGLDFIKLRNDLLFMLIKLKGSSFERFVAYSSICSVVQLGRLVDGLDELDELVEYELYKIATSFMENIKTSRCTVSSESNGAITVSDVYIKELDHSLKMSNQDVVTSIIYQFLRVFNISLYSSSLSIFILMQIKSGNQSICKASVEYLNFLLKFNSQLLYALILHIFIGLYESCNLKLLNDLQPTIAVIISGSYKVATVKMPTNKQRQVSHSAEPSLLTSLPSPRDSLQTEDSSGVQGNSTVASENQLFEGSKKVATQDSATVRNTSLNSASDMEIMILSGVLYSMRSLSNMDFINVLISFVRLYKQHGGLLDVVLLNRRIKYIKDSTSLGASNVSELLKVIGINVLDLVDSKFDENVDLLLDNFNRCLNLIKRKSIHVKFIQVHAKFTLSSCMKKTKTQLAEATHTALDINSQQSLDISPIVVQDHMNSLDFAPSTCIRNSIQHGTDGM